MPPYVETLFDMAVGKGLKASFDSRIVQLMETDTGFTLMTETGTVTPLSLTRSGTRRAQGSITAMHTSSSDMPLLLAACAALLRTADA